MLKLFRDGKIWTIPNLMSFFRLLLVPFIVWAYMKPHSIPLTLGLLALSALTDILDGRIARRFNMVSDLGKALDPVADKLTQVSIVLCLAFTYPLLWVLLAMCVLREICMAILSYITIRKTNQVPGARWYGKVTTVVLYASSMALVLFPKMPVWVSTSLIVLCMVCVVLALALYTRHYLRLWHEVAQKQNAA